MHIHFVCTLPAMNTRESPPEKTVAPAQDVDARMRIEIKDIGIPPRPQILIAIEQEMRKDEPDFIKLSKLIASDVALAAGLIKTANSPFFGFTKRVRSVDEALLVLGLKTITRTIAGLALQKIFPHVPSLERFWDASAKTARTAAWLTTKLDQPAGVRPADVYTFALFRDCGIPVLLIPFPEYSKVLQEANSANELCFTEVEESHLGINHTLVGAELAEGWLLPNEVCQAIRHHHSAAHIYGEHPEKLPPASSILIALAQTAEFLLQQATGLNQTSEWCKLGPACLNALQLTEDDLAALHDAQAQDKGLNAQ